jgi:hypothetical protein
MEYLQILQNKIILRFEANISLISTGYVNVDSQTSLIVTAAEQFEVNYELNECSPTRLMFMFQFVLPNEDTRNQTATVSAAGACYGQLNCVNYISMSRGKLC